ncbi:MAG: RsmG family class I SAM-dependent methyltransferase [Desulfovermiculus sp.]|nr:RsmG family class I SAM-dependent methyltransferase [Desulfovermiculus sp.]
MARVPTPELGRMARSEFPWLQSASLELLSLYISELLTWNKKINLVGKQNWESTYSYLVKDSLYLAELLSRLDLPPAPLSLDLGAGAGLPGIPLRIVWTAGEYYLVEPRQKRGLFLHHAVRTMSLPRTYVRICRAQEVHDHPADLILSRAMCPWPDLLSLARPMLSGQGRVVVFSNQVWNPAHTCPEGWAFLRQESYQAGNLEQRYFWVFSPMT